MKLSHEKYAYKRKLKDAIRIKMSL